MNKDKVLELLKTIQYPGFSRDIVSFGMVRDIIIDDDSVSIILQIKTQQEGKKQDIAKTFLNKTQTDSKEPESVPSEEKIEDGSRDASTT